jgi:Ca-activated chloride channel family protein
MRAKYCDGTMISLLAVLLLCASYLTISPSSLAAQGWIEPHVSRGGFSVDKTRSDVRIRVEGRVALVEVSEWFENDGAGMAEGDYLYPLPGEAVFQGFSLFQGDTELRGEIMDADEARTIYEGIVRRRADPALIELAGHGLLRARIFPIEPGEERKVTLRYTQVLSSAGNALQLVYAGAVRRIRGSVGGESPDGRALPLPTDISFEIDVADASRFLKPFSPTHEIGVKRHGDRMVVTMDEDVLGRLSVFLPFADDHLGLSVATHRPVGENGYFMLTLSPGLIEGAVAPRDVTVVLDVSGSMSGDKIHQAKQAIHQLLSSLGRDDRFRLISFSIAVGLHSEDWRYATGHELAHGREWVDELVADGGTDIGAALTEAFRLQSPAERLPIVVFMTDGLPSAGERSPERLADQAERQADRARVFAFGVGHGVNIHLLDRLGEAGRGSTDYIEPGESVERVIALLAAKIRYPILTDLELDGGPKRLLEVYPTRLPDVFAGQELVLFGRFTGDGLGQISVEGTRAGTDLEFSTELRFPRASAANSYLPRLWASRKLGHLERQLWTEGETSDLVAQIRDLALRYGLPSRYTSYLVQEPGVAATPFPKFMPIGVRSSSAPGAQRGGASSARGVTAAGAVDPLNASADRRASGQAVVRQAAVARARRVLTSVNEMRAMDAELDASLRERSETTRVLAGRVFVLDDGVWTDEAHAEDQTLFEVKAFSAVYFQLVAALPEIGAVLKQFEQVVIAGATMSLRITDAGIEELTDEALEQLVRRFRTAGGTP